ncbi:14467_t:CDS:2 [Funneliformis mosseae]|uniref:14467_t:CDS:1 n=1 Tax=Funneliformis mosseae TaxID=27381 RepID=A0A9N9CRW5_FUNMO|nr:14467_t:CDS:2 [Funneliformis mosseae]
MTRMKFEQFTTTTSTHRTFENVINESNHDESRSKTMWIPQGYQVTIAFWALTFLLFSLTTTSSIMMGLNRNLLHEENGPVMRRNKAFLYANGCLYGTFWFHCTFIIFILTFYGRNLLRMTEESFMLTGIQDAGSSNIPDRIKRRLEKANITFKAYINKLLSALWIGLLYTAISNFAPSICLFAILIAIVRAEMNPDQEAATAVAVIELNEINSFFSDVES